jgi:undecaprenyl-diphosphatase
VAAAVLVARRLGAVRSAALVLAGIGVAGVVGLTRIYLGAHYWSDVAGGWGLGLGVFGTLGAVAVLVAHIRQNALEPPRR